MFKSIILSQCTLCTKLQASPKKLCTVKVYGQTSDDIKDQLLKNRRPDDKINISVQKKRVFLELCSKNIDGIHKILKKYNIDSSNLKTNKKFSMQTPWIVEKKIMLIQEFGISPVTLKHVNRFYYAMHIPVNVFKAHYSLNENHNLAENMLLNIENEKINSKHLSHLSEDMLLKFHFNACLVYYLEHELNLNKDQKEIISLRRYRHLLYNSFRLLQQLIEYLKNELKFTNSLIVKNLWLLRLHPEQAKTIVNILKTELKDVSLDIILKYPRLLDYIPNDLLTLISYFKHYQITADMIHSRPSIFRFTSSDFKYRMDYLLQKPLTLVLQRHPKFLTLVTDFHIIIPRLRYLEDNNLKYATINTLTTFHSYAERLVSNMKMKRSNLKSFLESQFPDENVEDLIKKIQKHPCYVYVSLVDMYETVLYLEELFPKEVVLKHLYAILYKKSSIKTVYEKILKDPIYDKWLPSHKLALCIYELEIKTNFSGEGVFSTNPSESCSENQNLEDNNKNLNEKEYSDDSNHEPEIKHIISEEVQGKRLDQYKNNLIKYLNNFSFMKKKSTTEK